MLLHFEAMASKPRQDDDNGILAKVTQESMDKDNNNNDNDDVIKDEK